METVEFFIEPRSFFEPNVRLRTTRVLEKNTKY